MDPTQPKYEDLTPEQAHQFREFKYRGDYEHLRPLLVKRFGNRAKEVCARAYPGEPWADRVHRIRAWMREQYQEKINQLQNEQLE